MTTASLVPSRAAASALGDRLPAGATRAWLKVVLRSSETASIALIFDRAERRVSQVYKCRSFLRLLGNNVAKMLRPACRGETRFEALDLNATRHAAV